MLTLLSVISLSFISISEHPSEKSCRRWSKKKQCQAKIDKEMHKTMEQRQLRSIDRIQQKQILHNEATKHVEIIKTKLSTLKIKPTKMHQETLNKAINDVKVLSKDLISHHHLNETSW